MRYDITLPLLEGRVPIEGVKLRPIKSTSMINKEEPKLRDGDFGLMDLNIGYFAGKRIGSRTYRTALTVWARGLLNERYGVDFAAVHWVLQAKEVFPVHDAKLHIEYVDESKIMSQRLIAGELDAIITDISDT